MALAGGEIRERHFVSAADFRIKVMNFAGESIRWKPLAHRVGIQESPVNFLGRRPNDSVEPYGICRCRFVCFHRNFNSLSCLLDSFAIMFSLPQTVAAPQRCLSNQPRNFSARKPEFSGKFPNLRVSA